MVSMFDIPQRRSGTLWIMPCPKGALLRQSLDHYRQAGVHQVVSMLGIEEAALLEVSEEAALCHDLGLGFAQHPIEDFGLPGIPAFDALVHQIDTWLAQGQGVAVHCRAGIGRSGMVTAAALVAQGQNAEQAMAEVTHARGVSIPDTVEQGSFISRFAARFSK